MKVGEDFHLKIRYSNETGSEIVITINNGDAEIFKTVDESNFVPTTQYSVSEFPKIYILFFL